MYTIDAVNYANELPVYANEENKVLSTEDLNILIGYGYKVEIFK